MDGSKLTDRRLLWLVGSTCISIAPILALQDLAILLSSTRCRHCVLPIANSLLVLFTNASLILLLQDISQVKSFLRVMNELTEHAKKTFDNGSWVVVFDYDSNQA